VLLLDEPTNDLDVDTLTALEDLLDNWAGTLIAASHDRYFLERVCDTTTALIGHGQLASLPGGVDEYLARRSRERAAATGSATPAPAATAIDARTGNAGDVRAARKDLTRIERQLSKLETREKELHVQLAAVATDYVAAAALDAELRALHVTRAQLEEDWLNATDRAGA
jgi:ATP-binding cassette subfamily F protein uup